MSEYKGLTPKQRYEQRLKEIESDYQASKKQCAVDYAKEKNIYNIGDTVEDHIGKLIIEKITYYISYDDPQCIYHGIRLTKANKPIKGTSQTVYQRNLIEP